MHSKLDQRNAEIDALSAKADQVEAEDHVEYHKQMAALRSKTDEDRNRLIAFGNASESTWKDMKSGVEAA